MVAVSVIVPAYNAEQFIARAIESVLAQSCSDHELIVVDDGSNDDTARKARSYDSVRYFHQPNGGVSAARNRGAVEARGEFLAFLDADDIWHRDKLARQLAAMRAYPSVDLCRTGCASGAREIGLPERAAEMHSPVVTNFSDSFLNPFFVTSTVMVRASAFERVRGFDIGLRIAEDVDFYLRVLARAPNVVLIPDQLVFKREVATSLSADDAAGYEQLIFVYKRFLDNHPETYLSIGKTTVNRALQNLYIARARAMSRNLRNAEARAELSKAARLGFSADLISAWFTIFPRRQLSAAIRSLLKAKAK